MLRFTLSFLPYALIYFGPWLFFFAIFSSLASGISALRQVDLKKLIAYASINHMGLVLAGLTSSNIYSIEGSLHLMLSHGLVSAGLFFCIGSLYERFHTKLILYYSGLASLIPYNILFLFIFIQGNISFPGTWAFVSEILIFSGILQVSIVSALMFKLPVFLNTVYSILLFSKVSFGSYQAKGLKPFSLTEREFLIYTYLTF